MYDPNQVSGAVAPEEVLAEEVSDESVVGILKSIGDGEELVNDSVEVTEEALNATVADELLEVSDEVSDEVLAEELGVEEDFTV